jgi:hypothetical protein
MLNDKIRYTMKSESTGVHFTFCDRAEKLAREIKRLVEFNFVLVGVEGVDGFKCPPSENEFAHDSEGNLI